jgi:hypothetical protein
VAGCAQDTDCAAGHACVYDYLSNTFGCAAGCWNDTSCAEGYVCNPEASPFSLASLPPGERPEVCLARACDATSDCPKNYVCDLGLCEPGCLDDSNCAPGEVCRDTEVSGFSTVITRQCTYASCWSNSDCQVDEQCQDWACTRIPCLSDGDCHAEGKTCVDNTCRDPVPCYPNGACPDGLACNAGGSCVRP